MPIFLIFQTLSRTLGSISSRSGSPICYTPPNDGAGQGTRAHKTAGNRS